MEFIVFYIVPVVGCLILFTFNNYLVKKDKLEYQWFLSADIVWFMAAFPVLNVIFFVLVLVVVIYFLTKNCIEQN